MDSLSNANHSLNSLLHEIATTMGNDKSIDFGSILFYRTSPTEIQMDVVLNGDSSSTMEALLQKGSKSSDIAQAWTTTENQPSGSKSNSC